MTTTNPRTRSRSSKKKTEQLARFAWLIALLAAGACADRAPPARFPDTPPPELAKPLPEKAPEQPAEQPSEQPAEQTVEPVGEPQP